MILNPDTRILRPLEVVSVDNFAITYGGMKKEPMSRKSLKCKEKMSMFACHSRSWPALNLG
jgi:hypothetical protein